MMGDLVLAGSEFRKNRNGAVVHLGDDVETRNLTQQARWPARSFSKVALGETLPKLSPRQFPSGVLQVPSPRSVKSLQFPSTGSGADRRGRFYQVVHEGCLQLRNRVLEEFDVLSGFGKHPPRRDDPRIMNLTPRSGSLNFAENSQDNALYDIETSGDTASEAFNEMPRFEGEVLFHEMQGELEVKSEPELEISPMDTESRCREAVAIQRWRKMTSLIMSPKARFALTITFHVHECWADYLDMLRLNQRNSQASHAAAKVKIVSGRRTFMRSESALTLLATTATCAEALVMNPRSRKRMAWSGVACLLLLYESLMLPVNASFEIGDAPIHTIMLWFAMIVWVIDIPVTFLTGWEKRLGVEMRPERIAKFYAKSWLSIDLLLVLFDWVLLVLDYAALSSSTVRILRLVRLLRLPKLQTMLRDHMLYTSRQVPVISEMLELLLGYALYIHFLACAWYAIKKSDPEPWANGCPEKDNAYCYFAAWHWSVGQLYGTTESSYHSSFEWAFSAITMFVGMVLFAMFLIRSSNTISKVKGFSVLELRQRCIAYTKNHCISVNLTHRLLRHVSSASDELDVGQRVQQEGELLQILPLFLRGEILHEARRPLVSGVQLISDVEFLSKQLIVQLCSEAIRSVVSLSGELIFTYGDAASQWRIIESGRLLYVFAQEDIWSSFASNFTPARPHGLGVGLAMRHMQVRHTDSVHSSQQLYDSYKKANQVKRGASVSEMIIWTPWVHTGDMLATEDSVLLQIGLEDFHRVFKVRYEACLLAGKYAQLYVREMNSLTGDISDLQRITPSMEMAVDEENPGTKSHVIFLSHYKEEAGTEATLMQEALQMMLVRDNIDTTLADSAVFLDSEDLTHLGSLKDHVINSDNLVLLLTPRVLLRPWCIFEICTAMKNGVQIVPVEIQRPGIKFAYPDEEFFNLLKNGEKLAKQDRQLLELEGIRIVDVEAAIRFVFTQIALPFSPHRSKNVREAELMDIMKRCTANFPSTLGSHRSSSRQDTRRDSRQDSLSKDGKRRPSWHLPSNDTSSGAKRRIPNPDDPCAIREDDFSQTQSLSTVQTCQLKI